MEPPARLHVPAALLVAAGVALYGPVWQSPLSRALKLNSPRTVQRWAEAARRDDVYEAPRSMLIELLGLLEHKHGDVERAFDQLRNFIGA